MNWAQSADFRSIAEDNTRNYHWTETINPANNFDFPT